MTFKDIYEAMRMYRAVLTQLLERGAEEAGSAAHAELLQLLALKVGFRPLPCMPLAAPASAHWSKLWHMAPRSYMLRKAREMGRQEAH